MHLNRLYKPLAIAVCLLLMLQTKAFAQRPAYGKMSHFVRELVRSQKVSSSRHRAGMHKEEQTEPKYDACVFIRITEQAEEVMKEYGGIILAQFGNIYIANIPLDNLEIISADRRVERIEASKGNRVEMDTVALCVNAVPVYEAASLPQAFTGKGILMGIQDIGFDLGHPNFYDAASRHYRIRHLWDQLSTDTVGSSTYVGRTYEGESELLALGCVTDGAAQGHGTHTAGIAAGSGAGTAYKGIAYESELCLVANAVSEDIDLIPEENIYKYTSATDALGFKHIFDYADQVGMPCVISFSEGRHQYFNGDDQLYYEVLEQLTGPGRIMVASAGNEGEYLTYIKKEREREKVGTFLYSRTYHFDMSVRSNDPFDVRLIVYDSDNQTDTMVVSSRQVTERADSLFSDTTFLCGRHYIITMEAYRAWYDNSQTCYDIIVSSAKNIGGDQKVSIEWTGSDSELEVFRTYGFFLPDSRNPELNDAVNRYNVHCPGSAPSVICVGGSAYRTGVTNINGEWREYNMGTGGQRGNYSSVGPTLDERLKPDVIAPGMNVISSYSSYVLEHNPDKYDLTTDVAHTSFNGRDYPWVALSGTSMATPVVAGAIALWLEARPTLTPQEVMEVLSTTCTHYNEAGDYPNIYEGYGQIDIYKGLLAVLGLNHNDEIFDRVPGDVVIGPLNRHACRITFKSVAESSFTAQVFSSTGQKLLQQQFPGGQKAYDIDLTGYPKGIYVVQVKTSEARTTGSSLIRL